MNISGISSASISNIASATNGASGMAAVNMKLLSKVMDQQEAEGASMLKMLEMSADPSLGANFDMRV